MINKIKSYGYNNGVVITAPLFLFKEVFTMKRLLAMAIVLIISLFAFVGCGKEDAVSDMGSGVSEMASDAASSIESMGDAMTGGTVSDTDGIIGNEATSGANDNNENTDNTSSTEDNTKNQSNTAPSDTLI